MTSGGRKLFQVIEAATLEKEREKHQLQWKRIYIFCEIKLHFYNYIALKEIT